MSFIFDEYTPSSLFSSINFELYFSVIKDENNIIYSRDSREGSYSYLIQDAERSEALYIDFANRIMGYVVGDYQAVYHFGADVPIKMQSSIWDIDGVKIDFLDEKGWVKK